MELPRPIRERDPAVRLPPGRLALEPVLAALVEDGLVAAGDADRARASAKHMRALDAVHPLVLLANLKLPSRKPAGTDLSLERLTEWLAGVSGHRYLRIDPTRVDVATTTALV